MTHDQIRYRLVQSSTSDKWVVSTTPQSHKEKKVCHFVLWSNVTYGNNNLYIKNTSQMMKHHKSIPNLTTVFWVCWYFIFYKYENNPKWICFSYRSKYIHQSEINGFLLTNLVWNERYNYLYFVCCIFDWLLFVLLFFCVFML